MGIPFSAHLDLGHQHVCCELIILPVQKKIRLHPWGYDLSRRIQSWNDLLHLLSIRAIAKAIWILNSSNHFQATGLSFFLVRLNFCDYIVFAFQRKF